MTSLRSSSATPRARLAGLGLSLPQVNPPKGSYLPAVRSGTMVYVAGQVPMVDGAVDVTGKVGAQITVATAAELARRAGLAAIAAIDAVTDLDRVARVVKAVAYVACAEGFTGISPVVTEVAELLDAVFVDTAQFAAVGVPCLPLDAPVEIELTVELSPR